MAGLAIKGTHVFLFSITQPTPASTFTDAMAQPALIKIARAAKLF